MGSKHL